MSEVPPEVVARAQQGDAEAFRVIFEAHILPVRRFLADLLRDGAAADEASQETFMRAHAALPNLREGERLPAFLFGIARLVAREEWRKRRRDRPAGEAAGSEPAAEVISIDRRRSDGAPEAALLGKEADRALASALDTLSDERREALLLRLDHGLGYPEIAAALGWPLSKVKNEIHRARLQLREALAGFLAAEELP